MALTEEGISLHRVGSQHFKLQSQSLALVLMLFSELAVFLGGGEVLGGLSVGGLYGSCRLPPYLRNLIGSFTLGHQRD